jgi:hypothetical protein
MKLALAALLTLSLATSGLSAAEPALTFFGWSDQHTKTSGDTSTLQPFVDAMNTMPGTDWHKQIGGKVAKPGFVIGAGDITEWPTHAAMKGYDARLKERLKFPGLRCPRQS